jgi:PAS domain S-box-containing protein
MFNKKIVEKTICLLTAIFIIGTFTIFKKDLSHSELFLTILIFILILSRLSNKKELKDLSIKYEKSTNLLTGVFKNFPDAIFLKDTDSKYLSCNDIFLRTTNLKMEDLLKKGDSVFLNEEQSKRALIYDRQIIKNKETINYDLHYTTTSGEKFIYNVIKAPLLNEQGKVTGILGIARDVTVQEILKSTIEEKQSQLNAILENMPFCAYVKDLNGNFITGNKKIFDLTGKTQEELSNTNLSEIFPTELNEKIAEEDAKIIKTKETLRIEMETYYDSVPSWLEINKSPILNNDGEVIGIVIVFRDITFLKEIEKQKETFVATLTHDLKVPTIAQIKALELLIKGSIGELKEEQNEVICQILNSCRYVLNMISTLLSTYRYDEGVKKINYEEFDFIELISECCKEISCLAKEKEQTLSIKNNLTQNIACADKLEIKRVVTNLISNAIFYSNKNSQIEISMDSSNNELILLVNSQSKVIEPEQLAKLFDKYISKEGEFKYSSVGLGLYLTKQIINAHEGQIIAESDEINGNTFGFRIPQKKLSDIAIQEFSNAANNQE